MQAAFIANKLAQQKILFLVISVDEVEYIDNAVIWQITSRFSNEDTPFATMTTPSLLVELGVPSSLISPHGLLHFNPHFNWCIQSLYLVGGSFGAETSTWLQNEQAGFVMSYAHLAVATFRTSERLP